jgi:ribosomal protein S18 acetylase RimI-like enzyme
MMAASTHPPSDTGGIRPVHPGERARLLEIAVSTGLFAPAEAEALLGSVLDELAAGGLPARHAAVAVGAAADASQAIGWAYFAPDPYAANIWNLWWIGVDPAAHGTGAGRLLLQHVEAVVARNEGRVLVIETSDLPPMARARAFYARAGYGERGRIPDFYAEGEAKVIFSRRVSAAVGSPPGNPESHDSVCAAPPPPGVE